MKAANYAVNVVNRMKENTNPVQDKYIVVPSPIFTYFQNY